MKRNPLLLACIYITVQHKMFSLLGRLQKAVTQGRAWEMSAAGASFWGSHSLQTVKPRVPQRSTCLQAAYLSSKDESHLWG